MNNFELVDIVLFFILLISVMIQLNILLTERYKREGILLMENQNIKSKVLEVRISPELDKEFKEVVDAQGLTESDVVRSLVEGYIRKYEKKDATIADAIKEYFESEEEK